MQRQTISVKEAAEYLGISKDLVYSLVRHKQIPNVKVGRRILFRKEALNDWLERQEVNSLYN